MRKTFFYFILCTLCGTASASVYKATSPDGKIVLEVDNGKTLTYSVTYNGRQMIAPSPMGFEFVNERPMSGDFAVLNEVKAEQRVEAWKPVVRAKHAEVSIPYTSLFLKLKERKGDARRMDIDFRVMNEGIAFRYTLYQGKKFDYRRIQKELTGFSVDAKSSAWMSNFARRLYSTSQEGEFVKTPVTAQRDSIVKGLPYLIEVDKTHYMAILEANMHDWPGFYIGRNDDEDAGRVQLGVRLAPFGNDDSREIKVLFDEEKRSSWRVVLIGDTPGRFIESEVVRSLNPDPESDFSWVKPGISAWDIWWSMEDAVTLPVAKQYVDLAASQGWPYMLVDWKWYGKFNSAAANPLQCADYMDVPALIEYARPKGVGIWVWIHNADISQQDNWKEAFPLYERWGVKGVKIDFMDHENQYGTKWYRRILECAAKHHLMVDFHGAYKPDGIERTYPNMMTREGVMGGEYSKFTARVTPEHNVTLCFTRLLAGQMDYTPGGFRNVTMKEHQDSIAAASQRTGIYKNVRPAQVPNTRCQELAKFVCYESPLMVFCEHPDQCMGQPGMDFLREVPTTWDDIRFLAGYPGEHIELAKKCADGRWFVAGMNNSTRRTVSVPLSFLTPGKHTATIWKDARDADRRPTRLVRKTLSVSSAKPLTVDMSIGGGFVMIIE
ncbi:MAG: glycoside hydrolase family 97 protein [Prevotella sp.]